MKLSAYPWIIASLLSVFVMGLTYYADHRLPPDPTFAFYEKTEVKVIFNDNSGIWDVYGSYNNIVEGQRRLVKANLLNETQYKLEFLVNSPRPATLYINEETFEIFLLPDSNLSVYVDINPNTSRLERVSFVGSTQDICEYYQAKVTEFGSSRMQRKRFLSQTDDFDSYASMLDSSFQAEKRFLQGYNNLHPLPKWFSEFELSEITYQKAYLKRYDALNRDIAESKLDSVPLNNENAVFSYYYYLYLQTYISQQVDPPSSSLPAEDRYKQLTTKHLDVANNILEGEMHDVFLTRIIFNNLMRNRIDFAARLIERYRDSFNEKKYLRFLLAQLKELPEEERREEKSTVS